MILKEKKMTKIVINKIEQPDGSLKIELDPAIEAKLLADSHQAIYPDYTPAEQEALLIKNRNELMGSIRVVPGDCGTRKGLVGPLKKHQLAGAVGYTIVTDAGLQTLTEENVDEFVGKEITVRSPIFCQEKGENSCCETCYGPRNARTIASGTPGGNYILFLKI